MIYMIIDTMVFAYALLHVEEKYEQAIAVIESANSRMKCNA